MGYVRILVVAVACAIVASLYRNLPQNMNAMAVRYGRLSPNFRAARRAKLEGELAAYRAALADPQAFQAQALHRQAMIVLSAAMTLLAVMLFIASQLLRTRVDAGLAAWFPPIDLMLALFFAASLVSLRLAVFRSWMFLHSDRNLRRLERTIGALGAPAEGRVMP